MTKTPLFARHQSGGVFTIVDEGLTTGNVFFVDSGSSDGSDATDYGNNPDAPFATLDYAIGQCTANNGDRIYVMPGHTETVSGAAGIDFDVAGVTAVGLGNGADRPTITLSATASTVHLDAASTAIDNFLFTVSADATVGIDVDKTDCVLSRCEFRNAAAKEAVSWIDVNGGAANACDRTTIDGCVFYCPNAGTTAGVELGEVADRVAITNCVAVGDYGGACIHNPTGKVLTNLLVADCILENKQTGDHAVELVSACTGLLVRNAYSSDMTAPTGVDPGSCYSVECYQADAIDTSGILAPVAT